jgi:DAK2 domain fusion protein YloV
MSDVAVRLGRVPDSVDAVAVRRWCATGLDALRRHQAEIDALNVYPVPDGDTGTNLVLTMTAAVRRLEDDGPDEAGQTALGGALWRLARGALLGARGNSGVILSQVFKGLAEALATVPSADGRALAEALGQASRAAYLAVAAPVEGTILSVGAAAAKSAAEAAAAGALAASAKTGGHLGGATAVARAAADGARAALAHTPQQLPVLARAGVVDAGGRGLVVLLDALVEALTGEPAPSEPVAPAHSRLPLSVAREAGSPEFGYEVQYLLDAAAPRLDVLRARLGELGDSLVVVGSEPTWHVHVHVNDVGAAIEVGVEAGRPYRITVIRFADQMVANQAASDAGRPSNVDPLDAEPSNVDSPDGDALDGDWPDGPARRGGRAVVVVCTGDRLRDLFIREGATVVSGTPSTDEVLAAIDATGAGRVVVMPNDPNVVAVARAAAHEARAAGIRAGVVPTRSPVQALAALAVRDAGRRFEDDVIAMAEAAGACRSAEVTFASREALTVAGRCQPGDVLALIEGEVNLIGRDLLHTCRQLLDRLLAGGGELVTLVAGEDAPAGLGEALRAHVAEHWTFVELHCYEGGQPHYPLLVGVE